MHQGGADGLAGPAFETLIQMRFQPWPERQIPAEPALNQRDAAARRFPLILREPKGRAMGETVAAFYALISELQQLLGAIIRCLKRRLPWARLCSIRHLRLW
jgi:hypothetical protein